MEEVSMRRRDNLFPRFICGLCNHIFINATSISECLHIFCRECIQKKLIDEKLNHCPICKVDLGCSPLDKLRTDNNWKSIQNVLFTSEGKLMTAEYVPPTPLVTKKRKNSQSYSKSNAKNSFDPTAFVSNQLQSEADAARLNEMSVENLHKLSLEYLLKFTFFSDVAFQRRSMELETYQAKAASANEIQEGLKKQLEQLENAKNEEIIRLKKKVEELEKGNADALKNWEKRCDTAESSFAKVKEENASLKSDKSQLEGKVHELKLGMAYMYTKGFDNAIEQVKVLLPDVDPSVLSEADTLKKIEDGKLVQLRGYTKECFPANCVDVMPCKL